MPNETTSLEAAPLLNALFNGEILSQEAARRVMGKLMDGDYSQMQAAALLAALRTRGETVEEIVGFAEAMRERSVKVDVPRDEPLLDIVGTGGTGIDTFNISTTTLFVVAAGGVRIAKHGNRGATRKSGTADALEALGVNLEQTPERLISSILEVGVGFLFARAHHPAMKFVGPIRADIKARTIFNVLGPLTNPASAERQLMGVYTPQLCESFAQVLKGLGIERALVVHGSGLDELSVCGDNTVAELERGKITSYTLSPEEVGLSRYPLDDIRGDSAEANARTIRQVLGGDVQGAKRDIVLLNAGAGLYLAQKAETIEEGVGVARGVLESGAALAKLDAYVAASNA